MYHYDPSLFNIFREFDSLMIFLFEPDKLLFYHFIKLDVNHKLELLKSRCWMFDLNHVIYVIQIINL